MEAHHESILGDLEGVRDEIFDFSFFSTFCSFLAF
ncbi:MAG: hypothetical protein RJB38_825 [Pseudomonadota bacterium]